jgi:hypothetical protein
VNGDASGLSYGWAAIVWGDHKDEIGMCGSATLVTPRLLVTCTHVVKGNATHVTFPHAEDWDREYPITKVTPHTSTSDVALIELESDAPVRPARITAATSIELTGQWSTWGYPVGDATRRADRDGYEARGVVVGPSTSGKVQLVTHESSKQVTVGFSGAGVWSSAAQAVIAVVAQFEGPEVKGITMREVARCFPTEVARLATGSVAGTDDVAKQVWRIADDPDYAGHWDPRARGVPTGSERGYRFQGRRAALEQISTWLADLSDRRFLLVTGSPGVGKSAVLGRVITTADPVLRAFVSDDGGVLAPKGAVTVAIHAKNKSPDEIARRIADAAFVEFPTDLQRLGDVVAGELRDNPRSFTVMVDAIDESDDAHRLINQVLLPFNEAAPDLAMRVLVGTRRRDDHGDLLSEFGPDRHKHVIDLDAPEYFSLDDLVAYALASLQLVGTNRAGNAYQDITAAYPVAERIAHLADQNFLVAGLLAHSHGFYDARPCLPDEIRFEGGNDKVGRALHQYLDRIPPVVGVPARDLLTALAYAEAPGLPVELWRIAVGALFGHTISEEELDAFTRGSAANFLVETTSDQTAYRLFHEALNETLLKARR